MSKSIQLRDVPDDTYWDWKRRKEEGDYDDWTDFFMTEMDEADN